MDIDKSGEYVVTGSGDHGLRVYNLRSGKQSRQLYSKRYGHSDWVTSVAILNDGRVLSGSMDKRLCLWEKGVVKCQDLVGHNGSISKVAVDDNNVAISAAYDSSLLVWRLDGLECVQGLFHGHKEAVMEFAWANSLCVSGDRSGGIAIWDINTGKALLSRQGHAGAVSKIHLHSDGSNSNLILSGGLRDGKLNVLDMRTLKNTQSAQIHSGSINFVGMTDTTHLVTGSADKTVKVFDMRNTGGLKKPLQTFKCTDAVFCGELVANKLAVVGTGDGNLLAFDISGGTKDCLYGYGCD